MTGAQLKFCVVTGTSLGKQQKIIMKTLYTNAIQLTPRPYRPRLQREGGNASRLRRFNARQPIEILYVDISARSCREIIALKAVAEPILIVHRTIVNSVLKIMLRVGTWRSWSTCAR